MLKITDKVITDYSSLAMEISLLNIPIYFYTYDYDKYMRNRGVYIDFEKEMPGVISKDIKVIVKAIEDKIWFPQKIEKFSNKYIEKRKTSITKEIVKLIFKIIELRVLVIVCPDMKLPKE